MSKSWEKLGEEIRKTVQNAVENQDYEKLSQAISDTINQAVDAVTDGVKHAADYSQTKYQEKKNYTKEYIKKKKAKKKLEKPIVTTVIDAPSKSSAISTTTIGFLIGISQLINVLGGAASAFAIGGFEFLFTTINFIPAAAAVAGIWLGTLGALRLKKIKRFKEYVSAIGYKEYCNVSDLAKAAGITMKKAIKDMKYMIENGWFKQGHLDNQKTCLMITDKMYQEYCQLEQQKAVADMEAKERQAKEQKLQEEQVAFRKKLAPEVQKIIEQGDEYIRKIRVCNDAIPGEEVSEKIYHIEMVVDKIFDRVEQEPKCADDIEKLMDYYLPTTVKLLEAYAQMDAQPVSGENIQSAKKEIEATLDTLNIAFEKLLDSLFLEKAWDVSSDISVLNTMLAQEGLKEDGLKKS